MAHENNLQIILISSYLYFKAGCYLDSKICRVVLGNRILHRVAGPGTLAHQPGALNCIAPD